MKYELLKRTAIALFVGGVISTYAMAEDKPIEAAGNSFVKAIDAEITKQTEAVKTELTNSIAEKADKSAVDDINAELDARAKALKTLQEEKASVKDLNAISENVKEGFNSIQDKVHNQNTYFLHPARFRIAFRLPYLSGRPKPSQQNRAICHQPPCCGASDRR